MKAKLILSIILVFAISVFAQQRPRFGVDRFDPDKMIAHLSEELNLTSEQVAEIEPILLQTENKLNDLKLKKYDNDSEMMDEHRSIMEENADQIEKVLTDEQIEKFRELREQRPRFKRGDRPQKRW